MCRGLSLPVGELVDLEIHVLLALSLCIVCNCHAFRYVLPPVPVDRVVDVVVDLAEDVCIVLVAAVVVVAGSLFQDCFPALFVKFLKIGPWILYSWCFQRCR